MQQGSPMTLAGKAAAWSSALTLDRIPAEVVHVAKRCITDLVGVTIAGSRDPLCTKTFGYALEAYAPGACTIFGQLDTIGPVGAALANGAAGHVLDFDDTSYTGIMHGSTVVFPAALAAVEHVGGDGKRLLEAFIAGSEVTYAIAMLCATGHYFKGWWSTATFGVFGAAAAAARGLGLDARQTQMALAIAGVQASGLKAAFGTDAKPYMAGRAAAIGVEAALLAARGLVGPANVLEDSRGFLALLNDGHQEPGEIEKLGHVWRLIEPGIFFKQFPVCSAAHAAAQLMQTLIGTHALKAADVVEVTCDVTPTVAISLVHNRPTSPQEAQFSMPFALGAILAYGDLGISSLNAKFLADPVLRQAMAKITMVRDDALHTEAAPEGAKLTIRTRDGRTISGYLGVPKGMPANPTSDRELAEKFRGCCEVGGLGRAETDRLHQHLSVLETAATALCPGATIPPRVPVANLVNSG